MVNLKFVKVYNYSYPYYDGNVTVCNGVHLPEGLTKLSDKLILFYWDGYPAKSLPTTFNAENLVELCMRGSHVAKLWDGIQVCEKYI